MTSRKVEKQDRTGPGEARALARAEAVWSHVFALEWQRRQDLASVPAQRRDLAARAANHAFAAAHLEARQHLECDVQVQPTPRPTGES